MSETTLDVRLLHLVRSESEWKTSNPILKNGEVGYVQGTDRFKIGDGRTPWVDLPLNSVGSKVKIVRW